MLRTFFKLIIFISIVFALAGVNSPVYCAGLTYVQLARIAVESHLKGEAVDYKSFPLKQAPSEKVLGVFVTLLDSEKKSRGCWGELYPGVGLKEAIINAAIGSVKRDYRYEPVKLSEIKDLKLQVTIVRRIEPVSSTKEVNPLVNGMMVTSGGKSGILMPGEAIDAHYQMVQCKLKAGIQPGEPFNLFRLVTGVYKE